MLGGAGKDEAKLLGALEKRGRDGGGLEKKG